MKLFGCFCMNSWSDRRVDTRALRGKVSGVRRSLDHSFRRVSVSLRLKGRECVKASRHAVDVDENALEHLTRTCRYTVSNCFVFVFEHQTGYVVVSIVVIIALLIDNALSHLMCLRRCELLFRTDRARPAMKSMCLLKASFSSSTTPSSLRDSTCFISAPSTVRFARAGVPSGVCIINSVLWYTWPHFLHQAAMLSRSFWAFSMQLCSDAEVLLVVRSSA